MVNLTTPACPMKAQIEREVRTRRSRAGFPASGRLHITMGAEVRGKGIVEPVTSPASRT